MSIISPSHETMRLAAEAERIQSVAQSPRSDGKQPAGEAQSSRRTPLAAPFPIPQESSSQASAGNSASIAHDLGDLPLSIDPAFLAAWRESQGTVVDPKPMSPLIDPEWPFTVNREGMIIDMRTGEIDEFLTAQFCMGIS